MGGLMAWRPRELVTMWTVSDAIRVVGCWTARHYSAAGSCKFACYTTIISNCQTDRPPESLLPPNSLIVLSVFLPAPSNKWRSLPISLVLPSNPTGDPFQSYLCFLPILLVFPSNRTGDPSNATIALFKFYWCFSPILSGVSF